MSAKLIQTMLFTLVAVINIVPEMATSFNKGFVDTLKLDFLGFKICLLNCLIFWVLAASESFSDYKLLFIFI